jgi:hypothetical protein
MDSKYSYGANPLAMTRSGQESGGSQQESLSFALYATAVNGWSFAPLIRSHKIIAGSPSVSGMLASRSATCA